MDVREKIIAAARELFLEKGYRETKVMDIAKKISISPATIYVYFNGKKELFDILQIPEAANINPTFDNKRGEIIHKALLLFGEKGFDGTSMSMIAKKMGYSKAALYQYFENKEDLFAAVMKETPFHFNFLVIKPEMNNEDLEIVIRKIGLSYLALFDTPERTAFTRTIIRDSHKHPEISSIYHQNGLGYVIRCTTEYLDNFKHLFREDVNLHLAAETYVGSLFAYAIQYRVIENVTPIYTAEEFVNATSEIFLRGILK